MNAPERWLDSPDAPAGAAELLRALKPPPIPPEVHARLVLRVTELGATPAAGLVTGLTAKLGLAGTIGLAGIAAAVAVGETAEPPQAAVGAAVPAVVAPAPPSAVPSRRAPETVISVEELPREAPAPARRRVRDTLGEETELVAAARDALARGDAQRALSLVRAHEQRFARGQLRATAAVLATRALAKLGRTDDARREAARLVEREPSSLHAEEAEGVVVRSSD